MCEGPKKTRGKTFEDIYPNGAVFVDTVGTISMRQTLLSPFEAIPTDSSTSNNSASVSVTSSNGNGSDSTRDDGSTDGKDDSHDSAKNTGFVTILQVNHSILFCCVLCLQHQNMLLWVAGLLWSVLLSHVSLHFSLQNGGLPRVIRPGCTPADFAIPAAQCMLC